MNIPVDTLTSLKVPSEHRGLDWLDRDNPRKARIKGTVSRGKPSEGYPSYGYDITVDLSKDSQRHLDTLAIGQFKVDLAQFLRREYSVSQEGVTLQIPSKVFGNGADFDFRAFYIARADKSKGPVDPMKGAAANLAKMTLEEKRAFLEAEMAKLEE